MSDYYCKDCEFLNDRSKGNFIDGYCKKYNQSLTFYDWFEKCDKCVIETLQEENADLRARLDKAVELPFVPNGYYIEFWDAEIKPCVDSETDKVKLIVPVYAYIECKNLKSAEDILAEIEISNAEDRRTVAAILVANGYTVRQVKVKGSRVKTNIEAIK